MLWARLSPTFNSLLQHATALTPRRPCGRIATVLLLSAPVFFWYFIAGLTALCGVCDLQIPPLGSTPANCGQFHVGFELPDALSQQQQRYDGV
mmetsp:Transcript_46490/g.122776  ORF Transcript_46490/g.122776 Transcript_46490/m.122776 type:complete len:93 (-) Transcript_46490:271-549(-)